MPRTASITLAVVLAALDAGCGVASVDPVAGTAVSLAPNITEMVYALGLDTQLVGVTSACDWPEQAREKTVVGDMGRPNLEMLTELRPEVVLCTGMEEGEVLAALRASGVSVVTVPQDTLADIYEAARVVARALGDPDVGTALGEDIEKRVEAARSVTRHLTPDSRHRVFGEIWDDPLITCGAGSFLDEVITAAGGVNVASTLAQPYARIGAESVVASAPSAILLLHDVEGDPLHVVGSRLGWSTLPAVVHGRVYADLPLDTITRPGPRVAEGVEAVSRALYPALWEGIPR